MCPMGLHSGSLPPAKRCSLQSGDDFRFLGARGRSSDRHATPSTNKAVPDAMRSLTLALSGLLLLCTRCHGLVVSLPSSRPVKSLQVRARPPPRAGRVCMCAWVCVCQGTAAKRVPHTPARAHTLTSIRSAPIQSDRPTGPLSAARIRGQGLS